MLSTQENCLQNFPKKRLVPLISLETRISGYLFYRTAILKEVPYLKVVVSKSSRLLIPYFALGLATILLKVVFSSYMRRGAEISVSQLMDAFVWLTNMPLGELWFINTLYFFFLMYPLFRIASKNRISNVMLFGFLLGIHLWRPNIPSFVFDFNHIIEMAVYFHGGVIASRARFEEKLHRPYLLLLVSGVILGFGYWLMPTTAISAFIIASSGILSTTMFCIKIASFRPKAFWSFRDFTYQIFLLGIFFQIAARLVVGKVLPEGSLQSILLYAISIPLGIYAPVLIAKVCLKTNIIVVKRIFGLT